jgi:hypothetical protein
LTARLSLLVIQIAFHQRFELRELFLDALQGCSYLLCRLLGILLENQRN